MAWDNTQEFTSLTGADVEAAFEKFAEFQKSILPLCQRAQEFLEKSTFSGSAVEEWISQFQNIRAEYRNQKNTMRDLGGVAYCELSTNTQNSEAKELLSRSEKLAAEFEAQTTSIMNLFQKIPAELFEKYLEHEDCKHDRFQFDESRKESPFLLGLEEEKLLALLGSQGGIKNWGRLYQDVSGELMCEYEVKGEKKKTGFANAFNDLCHTDEATRKSAHYGITQAWKKERTVCCHILNGIDGWRHTVDQKRSHSQEKHYLDPALRASRLSQISLDAMLEAINGFKDKMWSSLRAKAKLLGKSTVDPWDYMAPCPIESKEENISLGDGIKWIEETLLKWDPRGKEFLDEMVKNRWIEARAGDHRMAGAYCTGFARSRTPRVYMTWGGTMKNVITLAHELGHAYHGWVLRSQHQAESHYPMTLAETASTYFETLLREKLLEATQTPKEKLSLLWEDIEAAEAFTLDIPKRYDFERKLYDGTKKGWVSADQLDQWMNESYQKYYGNTLSEPDTLFWAKKLHYYITGVRFYNYPYSFGYLLSLKLYRWSKEKGEGGAQAYIDFLQDTGRMQCEEIIQKHLGEDIGQRKFWDDALEVLEDKLKSFNHLVDEVAL